MKCKQIFSGILVAVLLFTLFSVTSLPASAAPEPKSEATATTITIPNASVEVGQTVKVEIKMTGVMAGLAARVSYDASRLGLTKVEENKKELSGHLFDPGVTSSNPFTFTYAKAINATLNNATILTLTFIGKAAGKAPITLTVRELEQVPASGQGSDDAKDLCKVTNGAVTVAKPVTPTPTPDPKPDPKPTVTYATKITPSATKLSLTKGKSAKLTYKLTPAKAKDTVKYSSSNTKVAKVDAKTGKITAVGPGTATITIKGKNKSATCKITVYSYVSLRVGKTRAIANAVKTTVDNEGTKPFKISGRTMIPLRFVGEKMGGKVKYISDSKPITLTYGTKKVEFRLNSKTITIYSGSSKTVKTIDVASQKRNGRTYIPLRAISQALGFTVYYQTGTELIVVNTPKMDVALRNKRLAEAKPYITK